MTQVKLINKKIEKHQELVGGFEHQELAIEISQALLELEKITGKDGLLEMKGVLKQMLRESKKKWGSCERDGGKLIRFPEMRTNTKHEM